MGNQKASIPTLNVGKKILFLNNASCSFIQPPTFVRIEIESENKEITVQEVSEKDPERVKMGVHNKKAGKIQSEVLIRWLEKKGFPKGNYVGRLDYSNKRIIFTPIKGGN